MSGLRFIGALDGARGILCMIIVLYHWPFDTFNAPFGWEGLQFFFIFSGFLIARILFFDKSRFGFKKYATRFFLRRFFRIFPLYFGYLFAFSFLMLAFSGNRFIQQFTEEMGRNAAYLYTYTYNFSTYFNFLAGKEWETTHAFGHLWSLAVEEQFYIVFPFVVFFMGEKLLKFFCYLFVFVVPFLRLFAYFHLIQINDDPAWLVSVIFHHTPFLLDAFALGTLIAMGEFKWIKKPGRAALISLLGLIGLYIFNHFYAKAGPVDHSGIVGDRIELWVMERYQFVYLNTAINITCSLFVLWIVRGNSIKWLLENKVSLWLGKRIYGVYVFHVPLLYLWVQFLDKKVVPYEVVSQNALIELGALIVYIAVLLIITHLSYKYFEVPFLKLKDVVDQKLKAGKAEYAQESTHV